MGRPDIFTPEILQICSVPEGRTAPEVGALTTAAYGTVIGKLPKLVKAGLLHQAGTRKRYRYFKELAHAEIWAEEQKRKAAALAADTGGRRTDLLPKIRALCSAPCGRSLPELLEHTGATRGSMHNRLPRLVDAGEIFRAGKRRGYRYFTHEHHAQAWEINPDPALISAARVAAEMVEPAEAAKPVATPTRRGRGKEVYGLGKAPHQDKLPAAAAVTWPAHVRVTVAPTPRDTRFTFDPPPGWKGELGRDWERKRSGGTS